MSSFLQHQSSLVTAPETAHQPQRIRTRDLVSADSESQGRRTSLHHTGLAASQTRDRRNREGECQDGYTNHGCCFAIPCTWTWIWESNARPGSICARHSGGKTGAISCAPLPHPPVFQTDPICRISCWWSAHGAHLPSRCALCVAPSTGTPSPPPVGAANLRHYFTLAN